MAASGVRSRLIRPFEPAYARLGQVQSRKRAQKSVGDEHVNARLRRVVDAPAESRSDRGVEVGDLDLDVQPRTPPILVGDAAHVDLQVAGAAVAMTGDE